MSEDKVAIIIPTRNRSHLLLERFRVLERNTPEIFNGKAKVFVAYDRDDVETQQLIGDNFNLFKINGFEKETIPCIKWNETAKFLDDSFNWFVTLSDDSLPHSKWLTYALESINSGFIGLPDGVTGNRNAIFTPLYMATRKWLKTYNGGVLVIPKYLSWYADMETAERAHKSGTYFVGTNSVVEQLHSSFGTAEDDEIYQLGASRRVADFRMYNDRKSKGFPDDFEGVL